MSGQYDENEQQKTADEFSEINSEQIPAELPILPLRNVIVYPYMVVPVTVGQPRSLRLVNEANDGDKIIGIVGMKNPTEKEPKPESLYQIGAVAKILRMMRAPDGNLHILVQGTEKMTIESWVEEEPYLKARVRPLQDIQPANDNTETEALRGSVVERYKQLVNLMSYIPDEMAKSVENTKDYRRLVYLISSSLRMDMSAAQEILELEEVTSKLRRLLEIINRELEVVELGKKIQTEAKTEMDKAQREYFLRQQLKAIQKELGEEGEGQVKVEEFRKKIETCGMHEEARKEAMRELSRMEKIPEASAEYGVIMTYLDWMTALPWQEETKDYLDIDHSREVLDEDHYSLEKIKERILEFLAVRQLRQSRADERDEAKATDDLIRRDREGAILCFVGPPGIGKTSLGQSIARAMGRKFFRISLGGIRDEAEIRGHRRTYIGALPGRFIQAVRRVASKNPVIMLDEVDKVGSDWRGDPSSALLEVLDPEQNREFRDHYLDVPFDLSQVMFIATANLLDTIPAPLRDRLEILELSGYTDEEKLNIAQQYLLPRQKRENGLRENELNITDKAVIRIMRDHTREAGVRNLERKLGAVCRKIAVKVAKNEVENVHVDCEQIQDYLGKPAFAYDLAERLEIPGVATGLAVTSVGGDILFVEATKMPGKNGLKITGKLGDVMKESVEAAVSYVRARTEDFGLDEDFFEKHDLHIHIPAGATPKDGPSAGVTLVTAITSLLTGRNVRKDVGMTGEITLRGKVLPVGGIKDKILAAHRAGLKTIILPSRNEKDLDDIPESAAKDLEIILVDEVGDVLKHALVEKS